MEGPQLKVLSGQAKKRRKRSRAEAEELLQKIAEYCRTLERVLCDIHGKAQRVIDDNPIVRDIDPYREELELIRDRTLEWKDVRLSEQKKLSDLRAREHPRGPRTSD